MSRIQLALDVTDIDEAVKFYTRLFATEPARRRPGYANFAIADPPLKLVLIEGPTGGTLNHLGVEVESADEVTDAERRLLDDGIDTTGVADTACCYATKTETWVQGPDNETWEWYVRTGDSEQMHNTTISADGADCCSPAIAEMTAS